MGTVILSSSPAMVLTNLKQLQELHELTRSQHLDLTVQVVRGDISIGDDISRAISCATKLIKGVVQAAMVLKVRFIIPLYPCRMQP